MLYTWVALLWFCGACSSKVCVYRGILINTAITQSKYTAE